MAEFPRSELEEMIGRYVETSNNAAKNGDWEALGQFYTDDAVYSWNNGPKHEFVARSRKEIVEWALGTEMEGLVGWNYPYVRTLIDDKQGEVIGIWRQLSPISNDRGGKLEIAGTGGSWFRYAGDFQWSWQRDFFDHGNAGALFMQLAQAGELSDEFLARMKKGSKMPGWIKRDDFDWYDTIDDRES